ncbi:MAG TPA: hypothetical protein VMT34_11435 [Aggregatilineales bacterium]|nr:hypothetical protein [Aggregatilineales bacterium]
MISPDEARKRLHVMIDLIPDEQVSLVWMTFQGMMDADDEDDKSDSDRDEGVADGDLDIDCV